MMNNIFKKIIILLITIIFTYGCSTNDSEYTYTPKRKMYPMRPANSSDAAVIHYTKKLSQEYVDVVSVGEGHLLVIPNSILFADQSPQLTWESYKILNDIISYIKLYRTTEITISNFVTPYGSKARQDSLSIARAKAVKEYLWSQDIDSRLIMSYGNGSKNNIVKELNANINDNSPNSRTEIRFFEILQ